MRFYGHKGFLQMLINLIGGRNNLLQWFLLHTQKEQNYPQSALHNILMVQFMIFSISQETQLNGN